MELPCLAREPLLPVACSPMPGSQQVSTEAEGPVPREDQGGLNRQVALRRAAGRAFGDSVKKAKGLRSTDRHLQNSHRM